MKKINKLTMTFGGCAVAALCLALASCASRDNAPLDITQGVVLLNVTVVNTRDGSLMPGMSVVVAHGKIQKITPRNAVRATGAALAIDASGKYVVPGFLDMHTHAMTVADKPTTHWPLLIANGITGIREMAGSPELIQRVKQLNVDSAAGRVDAPEVVMMAGPLIAGTPTAALGIQQVQQQKAMGAGFIKLVAASRDATLAILKEARIQGMDVAGHLVPSVTTLESSGAGWRAIEHLGAGMGVLLDCSTDATDIRRALANGEGARPPFTPDTIMSPLLFRALDAPFYQRIMATYNAEKCQSIASAFVKNETWQVPTLIRERTMTFSDEQGYRTDPNLKYVDKTRRALWESLGQKFATNVPASAADTFHRYYDSQKQLLKLLKQSGVKMLAGSDLGGIWVIPGFSLHQEFRELAASGLTPLEVLQMTTLNGAEFLHREATMGTVDEGKNADLVLLDANPLTDVANLSKIAGVVLKGKYFSKEALEKLKSDVADAYGRQPLQAFSTVVDLAHND